MWEPAFPLIIPMFLLEVITQSTKVWTVSRRETKGYRGTDSCMCFQWRSACICSCVDFLRIPLPFYSIEKCTEKYSDKGKEFNSSFKAKDSQWTSRGTEFGLRQRIIHFINHYLFRASSLLASHNDVSIFIDKDHSSTMRRALFA